MRLVDDKTGVSERERFFETSFSCANDEEPAVSCFGRRRNCRAKDLMFESVSYDSIQKFVVWLITIISSVSCKHKVVNIKSCFNLWSKTKKNLMGSWWNKLFNYPPRLKSLLSRLHTGCNGCFETNYFARINPNSWGWNSPPSWASFTTWYMQISKLTAGNVYNCIHVQLYTILVLLNLCVKNCLLHSLWYKSHKIYRKQHW